MSNIQQTIKKQINLVYFFLLPTGKIKIGESTISGLADRFDEAQRYFQGDVKSIKIIKVPSKVDATKMESFYKDNFKHKREIFDSTPYLLRFIQNLESAEEAEPYLRISRVIRRKERKRKRLIKLILS